MKNTLEHLAFNLANYILKLPAPSDHSNITVINDDMLIRFDAELVLQYLKEKEAKKNF